MARRATGPRRPPADPACHRPCYAWRTIERRNRRARSIIAGRRADRRLDRLLRACRHFHQGGNDDRSADHRLLARLRRIVGHRRLRLCPSRPRPAGDELQPGMARMGARRGRRPPPIAFIAAFKYTYVANVAVIYATVPFMAAAIEWLALGTGRACRRWRPRPSRWSAWSSSWPAASAAAIFSATDWPF